MEVQGIRAVVKLFSNPFQASAKVILPFLPTPLPIKEYYPSQLESPQVFFLSDFFQKLFLQIGQVSRLNPNFLKVSTG